MATPNSYVVYAYEYLGVESTKHAFSIDASLFTSSATEHRNRFKILADAKTKLAVHAQLCARIAALNTAEAIVPPAEAIPNFIGKTIDGSDPSQINVVA